MNNPIFKEGDKIKFNGTMATGKGRVEWMVERVHMKGRSYRLVSAGREIVIRRMVSFERQYSYTLATMDKPMANKPDKTRLAVNIEPIHRKQQAIKFNGFNTTEVRVFADQVNNLPYSFRRVVVKTNTGRMVLRRGEWLVKLPDNFLVVLSDRAFNQVYKPL